MPAEDSIFIQNYVDRCFSPKAYAGVRRAMKPLIRYFTSRVAIAVISAVLARISHRGTSDSSATVPVSIGRGKHLRGEIRTSALAFYSGALTGSSVAHRAS